MRGRKRGERRIPLREMFSWQFVMGEVISSEQVNKANILLEERTEKYSLRSHRTLGQL